jgi:hypothetical protein
LKDLCKGVMGAVLVTDHGRDRDLAVGEQAPLVVALAQFGVEARSRTSLHTLAG